MKGVSRAAECERPSLLLLFFGPKHSAAIGVDLIIHFEGVLASLVTINDFLSGESPAYFCDRCYYQFHYNSKNELLYDNF
ncbi:hypothetical protein Glove_134g231 [Diversispora epigaea]|uniref:Uncharacterized protein n=1 Tax=Diversispora epigaea TaxID=1348612 RepID=A0A397IX37_9GLOM|nr:hypothetical protein Glove_134g229 [Diversispora epigaea]RHZ80568.1 hypothetical protein Glove_134g231 [Diversispora epigaea]